MIIKALVHTLYSIIISIGALAIFVNYMDMNMTAEIIADMVLFGMLIVPLIAASNYVALRRARSSASSPSEVQPAQAIPIPVGTVAVGELPAQKEGQVSTRRKVSASTGR